MKRYISYVLAYVCVMLLSACNKQVFGPTGQGYLSLSMESDLSTDVIVKAGADVQPVYAIDVYNEADQKVAHADDHTTVTTANPIKLQLGTYKIKAASGEDVNAAFDNPIYKGEVSGVKIIPDKTTMATITCTQANTAFSVEFPADFDQAFSQYYVKVSNGIGESLILSNSPDSSDPLQAAFSSKAYFAVTGTLNWELYLVNKDGGEYKTSMSYTDVKAKSHYHLKFSLSEEGPSDGAFTITVTLDNTLDETDYDLVLDFDTAGMPSFSSAGQMEISSAVPVVVPVGNDATKILDISTSEGLKSFVLIHNNESLSSLGLPDAVEFVGEDAQRDELMSSLGIELSNLVQTKALSAGAKGVRMDITDFVKNLPLGSYELSCIAIDNKSRSDVFNLILEIISDVDAEAVEAKSSWAAFAKLEGRYFKNPAPEGLRFMYREKSASSWKEVAASDIEMNEGQLRFSTMLTGLKASTTYVFKAVSAKDTETKEIEFTTAQTQTIHNLNFDNWHTSGNILMPNAEGYSVWDSANSAGVTITTSSTNEAVSGKAARLESVTAFGLLAAGNIFTGEFVGLDGLGAKLNWGVPFTARPIALRGYYKYTPKAIDKVKDPYKDLKGQMDQSQILCFLTDWSSPFLVNTNTKSFVDTENDPGIIALGQLNSSNSDSGYVRFTIPLVYRDNSRIPRYIVIAAASSRYGDYFTGGIGSVLLVDEFELIYDPEELTDAEFNAVFSKVNPF